VQAGHRNLFLGNSYGKPLAPFAATAVDYFAPRGGAHALPETVRAFPASSVRLIRPLHWILRYFPGIGGRELAFHLDAVNDRPAWASPFLTEKPQRHGLNEMSLPLAFIYSRRERRIIRANLFEKPGLGVLGRILLDGRAATPTFTPRDRRRRFDTFSTLKFCKAQGMAVCALCDWACPWNSGPPEMQPDSVELFLTIPVS
jgi:hypothetical protein